MKHLFNFVVIAFAASFMQSCSKNPCGEGIGKVKDEAACVGRGPETLKGADEDYFAQMDYGISQNPDELVERLAPYFPGITADKAKELFVVGRNNWVVWTAGNDTLWDEISRASVGNADLLKTVSNHPSQRYSRDNRWQYLGVVNEPCYIKGDEPRADRWGLYLDTRDPSCSPDPFENEDKYPGIEIGARGKTVDVGSYYGYGTGVVGLRLFPNPDFDEDAAKKWDAERYYTDPTYYQSKDLIKPYRVGMSCGFCHVGPNPTNPPLDPENPTWANLNSNPGAQYFWVDRILMFDPDPTNFPSQLFHTNRPGALDTSLISSDYINNPRTMNAVYNLGARMEIASKWGKETLKQVHGNQNNMQFNMVDAIPDGSPLDNFYQAPETVLTPRVLKDGADSVGALGALNRVYINIGLFSDEWLLHFKPLLGGKKITPFEIENARKNSSFWVANEMQTPAVAAFFLAATPPDLLKNAPGGEQYLSEDEAVLEEGKKAFATTCARCHSSKLPDNVFAMFPDQGCVDAKGDRNYLQCWSDYWKYSKTDEFKTAMTEIVMQDDFLDNNFLSTELRVPQTLLETNACSPLASNAIEGNIWDNFSSDSYKNLPSVGVMKVQNPFTGELWDYKAPGGGRGYTRPASLVSVWSSAPFLLNNSLGDFYWTGSVDDRIKSFDDSIEKLLWPEKRDGNFTVITKSGKTHPGTIDLTSTQSYLSVPQGFLPKFLQPLQGTLTRWLPWLFDEESRGIKIGPIPEGIPVNLLSNIDMEERKQVLKLLLKIKSNLKEVEKHKDGAGQIDNDKLKQVFANLAQPLIDVSKCPDYVVDKGHYFGTQYLADEEPLSDEQKLALIEFLKTF